MRCAAPLTLRSIKVTFSMIYMHNVLARSCSFSHVFDILIHVKFENSSHDSELESGRVCLFLAPCAPEHV